MKHVILSFYVICTICFCCTGQEKSLQEKLGYAKDAKLLIVHADDLGVSHSENRASIQALEKGSVSSASILVPCPWLPEIGAYAKSHPDADLGIHLALTSEWKFYKWGPVMSRDKVTSLLNDQGYFFDNTGDVIKNAKPAEAELELRAQVEKAIKAGINPTHFDAHMGAVMAPSLIDVYLKLSEEYKVPVLLLKGMVGDNTIHKNLIVLDGIIGASPDDFKKDMKSFYANALKSIQPGVRCLIIHAAYDDAEMQAVTVDHPDWGSAWRQADFDFFTSEECKAIMKEQKIQLITWKEIRDKVIRGKP